MVSPRMGQETSFGPVLEEAERHADRDELHGHPTGGLHRRQHRDQLHLQRGVQRMFRESFVSVLNV
jgi:hypothetical protein